MKKREILSLVIIYTTLAFFALGKLFLASGTLGHNWDWFVPPLPFHLQRLFNLVLYVWRDVSLGFPSNDYSLTSVPFYLLVGSLGFLGLGGGFVSKALLFLTIVISGISMFLLASNLLGKKFFPSFFSGLFYAFSPFLFNEFVGGSATQFFTYAFLPLSIYFFLESSLLPFVLTLSIITFSYQNLFFALLIVILHTLFFPERKKNLKFLLKSFLLYFPLNGYWIIPLIFNWRSTASYAFSPGHLTFTSLIDNVPSLYEAILGLGYFSDFFAKIVKGTFGSFWTFFIFQTLVFLFTFYWLKTSRRSIFWLGLFLFSLIFSTGGKVPFGGLVLKIYEKVPLMTLFRSPQHLMTLTTFSLAVFLGFSTLNIFEKRKSRPLKAGLFLLLAFWLFPFLTGDLGYFFLKKLGGGSYVTSYNLSPGYQKILLDLSDSYDSRVLFFPLSHSPFYLETEYQKEGQGGEPLISYGYPPVLSVDLDSTYFVKEFIYLIEEPLYFGDKYLSNLPYLLSWANVENLVIRADVVDNFGRFARAWRFPRVRENLLSLEGVTLVEEYPEVLLFRNAGLISQIYALEEAILVKGEIEDLNEILLKGDYGEKSGFFIIGSEDEFNSLTGLFKPSSILEVLKEEKTFPLEIVAPFPFYIETEKETKEEFVEIPNFDPRYNYKISFSYKNILGSSPRFVVEESTCDKWPDKKDKRCASKIGLGRGLENASDWLLYEGLYEPSLGAKRARVVFFADKPSWGKTINLYDKIKVEKIVEEKTIRKLEEGEKFKSLPEIKFEKINPTKYKVHVTEAENPYFLVFSERFHQDWKIYKAEDSKTWEKNPIAKNKHFIVNGFANSWYIEPADVDDKKNYTLILEFSPQRLYRLGMGISGLSFFLILGSLGILKIRKKQ